MEDEMVVIQSVHVLAFGRDLTDSFVEVEIMRPTLLSPTKVRLRLGQVIECAIPLEWVPEDERPKEEHAGSEQLGSPA